MMTYPDDFPLKLLFPDMQPEVREIQDGVYSYTFTPPTLDDPVYSGDGVLPKEDIDQMLQWMYDAAKKTPQNLYFTVSLETYWSLKRVHLYGVNHLPRRKIRKCFLRKRQARINQGKRHLLRCQKQMAHREPEKFTL